MLLQVAELFTGVLYILLFVSVVQLIFTYLVYQDAKKYTTSPELWAILVFLTPLIGLILYLLVGRDRTNNQGGEFNPVYCTECGTENPYDASHCRECGSELLDTESGKVGQSTVDDDDDYRRIVLLALSGIPGIFLLWLITMGDVFAFTAVLSLVAGTSARILQHGVNEYYRGVLYISGKSGKESQKRVISGEEILRLLGGSAFLTIGLRGLEASWSVISSTELRLADIPGLVLADILFTILPVTIAVWLLFGNNRNSPKKNERNSLRLGVIIAVAIGIVLIGIRLAKILL